MDKCCINHNPNVTIPLTQHSSFSFNLIMLRFCIMCETLGSSHTRNVRPQWDVNHCCCSWNSSTRRHEVMHMLGKPLEITKVLYFNATSPTNTESSAWNGCSSCNEQLFVFYGCIMQTKATITAVFYRRVRVKPWERVAVSSYDKFTMFDCRWWDLREAFPCQLQWTSHFLHIHIS